MVANLGVPTSGMEGEFISGEGGTWYLDGVTLNYLESLSLSNLGLPVS